MPYVPQAAIDIFSRSSENSPKDVVKAKIRNSRLDPCSGRTARRWHLYFLHGVADPSSPPNAVDAIQEELDSEKPLSLEEGPETIVVTSVSEDIVTLEQLIATSKVDLSLWKVDHHQIKFYPGYRKETFKNLEFDQGRISGTVLDNGELRKVRLCSITAWFVPREEKPFEDVLDRLIAKFKEEYKPKPIKKNYPKGEYLFIPAILDAHIGRRDKTSTYTVERAASEFVLTGEALISRALALGMPIDRILFPVGNDLLNADNLIGQTTKGTWQEMSAAQTDAVDAAVFCCRSMIDRLMDIAPVDVVLVPDNHGRYSTYLIGKVLEAAYETSKYVTIDNRPKPRIYYPYGRTLIGMEHGDQVKEDKLALLMASEAKEMWGSTEYKVFLRGHFHKSKELYQSTSDDTSVSIITFPAFCPPDRWEEYMGFVGKHRAAEARFFHKEHGPAGMFPVFVDEIT